MAGNDSQVQEGPGSDAAILRRTRELRILKSIPGSQGAAQRGVTQVQGYSVLSPLKSSSLETHCIRFYSLLGWEKPSDAIHG